MKKYLILFAMFIVMPAYAMCPVEDGAAVCSLPGFREQVSPIYNPKTNINEFSVRSLYAKQKHTAVPAA